MRGFEKISFNEFKKVIKDDKELYLKFLLPTRKTSSSAGYDISVLEDTLIKAGEIVKIKTGVKAFMQSDEVLFLLVRSSMGFKYNLRLCNQVGVIDSDYYNNIDNEGHIFVALQNEGENDLILRANEAVVQGIFIKYLVGEDTPDTIRIGGIGSTNERN